MSRSSSAQTYVSVFCSSSVPGKPWISLPDIVKAPATWNCTEWSMIFACLRPTGLEKCSTSVPTSAPLKLACAISVHSAVIQSRLVQSARTRSSNGAEIAASAAANAGLQHFQSAPSFCSLRMLASTSRISTSY